MQKNLKYWKSVSFALSSEENESGFFAQYACVMIVCEYEMILLLLQVVMKSAASAREREREVCDMFLDIEMSVDYFERIEDVVVV